MPEVFAEQAHLTPGGQRVLQAASTLFYDGGIHAVGVEAIADAAGTTKKTLYDCFGSKDALVRAYLHERARRWQLHLLGTVAVRRTARGRALAVFDALETWMAGNVRGCAFVNAYAEFGDRSDHPATTLVRDEKQWMREFIAEQVRSDASIRPAEAARLADVVHLLYEGALVALTAGDDALALATARRAAETLLRGSDTSR